MALYDYLGNGHTVFDKPDVRIKKRFLFGESLGCFFKEVSDVLRYAYKFRIQDNRIYT